MGDKIKELRSDFTRKERFPRLRLARFYYWQAAFRHTSAL